MSLAKLRQDYTPLQPTRAPNLSVEFQGVAPAPSPALLLQQQLMQRTTAAHEPNIEKWSPRRSLALIVSASAALWMAILIAGIEASKAFA